LTLRKREGGKKKGKDHTPKHHAPSRGKNLVGRRVERERKERNMCTVYKPRRKELEARYSGKAPIFPYELHKKKRGTHLIPIPERNTRVTPSPLEGRTGRKGERVAVFLGKKGERKKKRRPPYLTRSRTRHARPVVELGGGGKKKGKKREQVPPRPLRYGRKREKRRRTATLLMRSKGASTSSRYVKEEKR